MARQWWEDLVDIPKLHMPDSYFGIMFCPVSRFGYITTFSFVGGKKQSVRRDVLDGEVFHGFDKPSLDVACAGCLDGCIDQTFSTSHGVEEQLLGGQTPQVGVLNKASGLRTQVIFGEVGQCAAGKSEWDTLAFHILLANTSNHLQSDEVIFGSSIRGISRLKASAFEKCTVISV